MRRMGWVLPILFFAISFVLLYRNGLFYSEPLLMILSGASIAGLATAARRHLKSSQVHVTES